jgi:hypothetical protein
MSTLCPLAERAEEAVEHDQKWTLGRILRVFLPALGDLLKLSTHQRRVLGHLAACGTGELGENLYACPHCGHQHWAPRSCGDRHCPRCLAAKSRQWLDQQMGSLLPVTYYHWVFTLPEELNPLIFANQRRLYKLLFDCAAQSLLEFGRQRLEGELGITAVLHTWGQQLHFHPHLHCIVTGGALSPDQRRWHCSRQRRYLFPVKACSALFRGKFLAGLKALLEADELYLPDLGLRNERTRRKWLSVLYASKWVTYAKRPFGGPRQVLSYLAHYTHRVALSNRRIVAVDAATQTVTLSYRDYRDRSKVKPLFLSVREFIRRFSLHILPSGLVRIRHYGILGNNRRKADIAAARAIFARRGRAVSVAQAVPTHEPPRCPACGQSGLRLVGFTEPDGTYHLLGQPPALCDSS